MIRHAVRLLLFAPCLALAQPSAQSPAEPLVWLNRMAEAAQTLDYSGTFVFQSGTRSETSRVAHALEGGREIERLEVLDGTPREIVRENDEVRCYLPDVKRVLVEKRVRGRFFPALVASGAQALAAHYAVRTGGVERVAGHEAQLVVLDAKDAWRYSHRLWAEVRSGLILKAQILDDRQRLVEQFTFTQLAIGGAVDRSELQSRQQALAGEWQTEDLSIAGGAEVASGWRLRDGVPGFAKTHEMRRLLRKDGVPVTHLVFSDGLAAVSVFIAPPDAESSRKPWSSAQGAINVHTRMLAGHVVTVLGEVPPATAMKIANGIEYRKP